MKRILKNMPFDLPPSIKIEEGSPEWEEAYKSWSSGKNPTSSDDWKPSKEKPMQGVFFAIE